MRLEAPDWHLDHGFAAPGPIRLRFEQWHALAARLSDGDAVERLAAGQGLVVRRDQVRTAGVSDADVRRLVRTGQWSTPRRGILCPFPASDDPRDPADPTAGARPEMAGCAAALAYPRTVVSYASAAALDGLPLLAPAWPPTITAGSNSRAVSWAGIRIHATAMTRSEVRSWFGTPVTTAARTVIDLARDRGVRDGLVAADAALHERLTTMHELQRVLRRQAGWPGVVAARRVVDLADGRAESPLESLTRLCVIDGGLPVPEPQVWVEVNGWRYRVDLMWPALGVIVEADGMSKYRAGFEVVTAERRRHERLDRAGYLVIRVTWDEVVSHPAETLARIRAALIEAGCRV